MTINNIRTFIFSTKTISTIALLSTLLISTHKPYAALSGDGQVRLISQDISIQSDQSLPKQIQQEESDTLHLLTNRSTEDVFTAYGPATIYFKFAQPKEISRLKLFGPAPYRVTLQYKDGDTWHDVNGVIDVNMVKQSALWNSFDFLQPVVTDQIRMNLKPANVPGNISGGSSIVGIKEMELWGKSDIQNTGSGRNLLEALQKGVSIPQGKLYQAKPSEGIIGDVPNLPDDIGDNSFTLDIDNKHSDFKRAWLTYNTYGAGHWVSPIRSINGHIAQGGIIRIGSSSWSSQVEPINPEWLNKGSNTIEFSTPGKPYSFNVSDVSVLVESDIGTNPVDTVSAWPEDDTNPGYVVLDGSETTGWRPYATEIVNGNSDKPHLDLNFTKSYEIEHVMLYLASVIDGKIEVDYLVGGAWQNAGITAINGKDLQVGWNSLPIQSKGNPIDGIRLRFINGSKASAEISEIVPIGSGVGATYAKHIEITYPEAGEYYGDSAYLRGFVQPADNGSGAPRIYAAGTELLSEQGGFEGLIDKNLGKPGTNGAWSVDIKAVYPNGQTLTKTVNFWQPGDPQTIDGEMKAYYAANAGSSASSTPGSSAVPGANSVIPVGVTVENDDTIILEHDEGILELKASAKDPKVRLSISSLKQDDLPPLDPGMVNVTKGPRAGYRFLPHGTIFKKNVKVKIPYDGNKIPLGFTADDVKTYYYDTDIGHWVPLERTEVSQGKREIISNTKHFTDMINATLVMPESPNPASFNETTIKDLKAADPGTNVNLIAPPQANNMGDARLSYPIEIPTGRNNLSPQLSIDYNSAGSDGWLGLGWDLSTPSISIDTRFGVPRYDESVHEEIYLFNGQQLVRTGKTGNYVEYRPRIESAFNRIRRYGSSAGEYWWVVTTKSGTRYFYGGDENARLRNDSGDRIFTWFLNRIVDSNGNTVDYQYDVKKLPNQNNGEPGIYTYLKEIRYPGYAGTGKSDASLRNIPEAQGNYYRIGFERETGRLDTIVNGRPGFKTVLDEKLKKINVDLVRGGSTESIRSYVLNYQVGDFDKTLLKTIVQNDADGHEFNHHDFDYFKMPETANGYDGFAPVEVWTIPSVGSGLSNSNNSDRYIGGYVGLGINTPNIHYGFNRGWGEGSSETKFTATDVNGDGLPDFLQQGGQYYVNNWEQNGQGARSFAAVSLNGAADQVGKDENKVNASDSGLNLDASWTPRITASSGGSTTDNKGKKMMADINGDGLVDQLNVSGGGLSVRLNNGNGFNAPIAWTGGVNITPPMSDAEKQELLDTYPLSDTVRAWMAPYGGTISLSGNISKETNSDTAKGEDGVKAEIFKGTSKQALWSKTYTTAESVNLSSISALQNLDVQAGERIYLKLSSIQDIHNDQLKVALFINYSEIQYTDSNGRNQQLSQLNAEATRVLPTGQLQFVYGNDEGFAMARPAREDLNVGAVYAWSAPFKGKVKLTQILKKQTTAENMLFQVVRVRYDHSSGNEVSRDVLFTKSAAGNESLDETLGATDDPVELLAGDRLIFDVSLPDLGSVDATRFSWKPEVRYIHICVPAKSGVDIDNPDTYMLQDGQSPDEYFDSEKCQDLTPEQQELTDYDLPGAIKQQGVAATKLYIFNPSPMLNVYPVKNQEPVQAWIAPRDGKIQIALSAFKNVKTPSDIHTKVQGINKLIASHTYAASEIINQYQPQTEHINLDVTKGQKLFFTIISQKAYPETAIDDSDMEVKVFQWEPEILYVDKDQCYTDPSTGNNTCVPVNTRYTGGDSWGMHFDELCLSQDRCVVVDCGGGRGPGHPTSNAPGFCRTTEKNPDYDPSRPVETGPEYINVDLTPTERATFNLNRVQYMVPNKNRQVLDWEYYNTPLAGQYRNWAYVSWNGSHAWDPGKLELLDGKEFDDLNLNSQDDQIAAGQRIGSAYYFAMQPEAFGNSRHVDVPLWQGAGIDDYISASESQPSRIGSDISEYLNEGKDFGGAGIRDLSRTKTHQNKKSLGIGPLGASYNEGPSDTQISLIDLNGDRYPDQVSETQVVFNNGHGGYDAAANPLNIGVQGFDTIQTSYSKTAGLSYAIGHIFPDVKSNGIIKGIKSLGPNIGTNYGSSRTKVEFMDINGDGLPDRVYRDGTQISVRLNLGYNDNGSIRFGKAEVWAAGGWSISDTSRLSKYFSVNSNAVRVTDTVSASVGGGYGVVSGSFSVSGSRTLVDLRDINGDGLPDLLMKQNGEAFFRVRLNRGDGFGPEQQWKTPDWGFDIGRGATAKLYGGNDVIGYQESWTQSGGLSLHYQWAIPIPFCCVLWPHVKGDGNISSGEGGASLMMMDVDGDGAPDQVYRTSNSNKIYVKRNKVGKANLLKSVQRPMGGSIDLDYERDGNFVDRSKDDQKVEMNTSKWVVDKTILKDGQGNTYTTIVHYFTDGYFDRAERENYGYAHVQEVRPDGAMIDYFYHNQDYTEKGLLYRQILRDKKGNLFTRTEDEYKTVLLVPAQDGRKAVRFPEMLSSTQHFYEGTINLAGEIKPSHKFSSGLTYKTERYQYETVYGNVTQYVDEGNPNDNADDVIADIRYFEDKSAYIVDQPDNITVTGAGGILRKRSGSFERVTGNMREFSQWVNGDGVQISGNAVTKLEYDSYGNISHIKRPTNNQGKSYELWYEYDPLFSLYPANTRDSFDLESKSIYSLNNNFDGYKFGRPIKTTDVNHNIVSYAYDAVGRMQSIVGPKQQGDGSITIGYEYHPNATVPYAVTHNLDEYRNGDPIDTVVFVDGMGRMLQTKKDASFHAGADSGPVAGRTVSGRVFFDSMGRVAEQYYPRKDSVAATKFNTSFDSSTLTKKHYDILGRVTHVTYPDKTEVNTDFSISSGQFVIRRRDRNGNDKTIYKDIKELTTRVDEGKNATVTTAQYSYDGLGQLVKIKDNSGNTTSVKYDTVGQMISVDNPDAGRTDYSFDLSGNLIKKATANLLENDQAIEYSYDRNRLTEIYYPNFPENNVHYVYGKPGDGFNRAGRAYKISYHNGSTERKYGSLGDLTEETRTVTLGPKTKIFTTGYEYDSFGRLHKLRYPDGETLSYTYDAGGNLNGARGVKDGQVYTYLKRLEYDEFEQRVFEELGNGVRTTYSYDHKTRRLDNLASIRKGSIQFQNLDFGYDNIGNVTSIKNDVEVTRPNVFGGPTSKTFKYDDLYRLVSSEGKFEYKSGRWNKYTMDVKYNGIHNILSKEQTNWTEFNGKKHTLKGKTYDWAYDYNASGPASVQPHAPKHIGNRAFFYDANGNQTGWKHDRTGQRRNIIWDDENRIQEIQDPRHTLVFAYDDTGRRIYKRGRHGTTIYVNQYYSVTNGATASKHVFAGTTRIATQILHGEMPETLNNVTAQSSVQSQQTSTIQAVDTATHTGNSGKAHPGQGTGNGQSGNKNPNLGNLPGQGLDHRSASAWYHAQDMYKNPHYNWVDSGDIQRRTKFLYFYHPDHLGSTSFVTDSKGDIYEHVQYFPFGETWIQQATNSQRIDYLFTSKELDSETGLYYYGARYYDPRTSVWQSADPALYRFLGGQGGLGGIYESRNLSLYSYAHQRPINAVDPDGNSPIDILFLAYDVGKLAVAVYNGKDVGEALVDVAIDVVAVASPVPGVGEAYKATRTVAKVAKAVEETRNAKRAVEAGKKGEEATGIVYKRINRKTGEEYIGQAKSPKRFKARQKEHDKKLDAKHDYEVLGKAKPGKDLDVLEETKIREHGGLQKEGGKLANKRHQMSETRYREHGGTVDNPTR